MSTAKKIDNRIHYGDLMKMSHTEIDNLLIEGVRTGKMIDIKSREDFRAFVDSHKRVAASMNENDLEAIEALAGYCMELGI